jgi:hypothetical protein
MCCTCALILTYPTSSYSFFPLFLFSPLPFYFFILPHTQFSYIENPTPTFIAYPQTISSSNSIFWLIPFAYGGRGLTHRGWRDEAKRKILGILSLNPAQSFTICVVHATPTAVRPTP